MKLVLVTSKPGYPVSRRTTEFSSHAEALQYIINNQPVVVDAVRFEEAKVMQKENAIVPGEGVNLKYAVATFRAAGLESRWTKTRKGAPIIAAREPGGGNWYVIDAEMWAAMEKGGGVLSVFKCYTTLGEFFSIPA